MKSFNSFAVIFSAIVYCVLASPQLFAQNNQFNNYAAPPQHAAPYLGTQYVTVPAAAQPLPPNINNINNVNNSIAPTLYQPAFAGNSANNNITQVSHLSATYPPARPDQTITAKPLPTTYSPFPTPNNHTPNPNPNPNYIQNQIPYPANNINNQTISTVGFVAPTVNHTTTTTNPQNTTITPATTTTINNPLINNSVVGNSVAVNYADNNSAAFVSRPVAGNNSANNTAPNIIVTNNPASKFYKLQHLTGSGFETKLIKKLGQRFIPVRNVETSRDVAKYKLPVKNGSNVELTIERANGIVTVTGVNAAVDNCIQIVRLLDLPESRDGSVTEFVTLSNTDSAALRQAVGFINQSGQSTVKLVQNQPAPATRTTPTPPTPPAPNPAAPNANFNPNTAAGNNQTNAGNNKTNEEPQDNTSGTVLGPVRVNIIDGLDTYVIFGQPNDVAAVQRIIDQIDKISLEYEPVIELVPVKQADSLRVCTIVQQLYLQIYASRRGTVIMLPLVKPNTILMIGKKENLDMAKELVSKLDLPVNPKSQFKIFRLKNAQAETLQQQIQNFYQTRIGTGYLEQQVNIIADARTNALVVQANPRDLQEVETMIGQLDVKGSEAENIFRTFTLKNAVASELVTTLQNIITGSSTGTGNVNASNATSTQTRNPLWVMLDNDKKTTRSISTLYDIRISADTRSNMIIVSAPSDTMVLIEMLIKQLDQHPSAESVIKIFTLVNADAYTLTTMLQNLFSSTSTTGGGFGSTGSTNSNMMTTRRPGIEQDESTLVSVRFVAEVRTNSIIAIGSAGDMMTVETILMRLDEENMNNRKIMTIKLINTPAAEIAPVIQQYVTNERQLETQNITTYSPQSPKEQYQKEVVIVAEPISNTLIISCTPRYYEQIRGIVQRIDERPRVVSIQCLIAEVSMNNKNERGFEIGLQDSILFERSLAGTGPGFLFGNDSTLPTGIFSAGKVASQGISQLGTGRVTDGIGGFTFSASSESVSVLMRALAAKDKLRILSKPQLTTMNNMRAVVEIGQRVPFAGSSTTNYNGYQTYTTDWQDVGTSLDITPRITSDDQIVMAIYVGRSSLGSDITTTVAGNMNSTPIINQERIQTSISAMDNQTVIIGGLITEQKEMVNRSIPVLNKIPVIKHLFEYELQTTNRSELLIILTPTIIRSNEDMERLKQQEYSRLHWCLGDVVKLTGKSEMRMRTDAWLTNEIPHVQGTPTKLKESQLPPEENIKKLIPVKIREE
ncbi:MAG: hypothetical protein LBT09_04440 [Planctomycetaceae bacterium]|nr:hypothetical protein [Planctomycetaceae bacterium]